MSKLCFWCSLSLLTGKWRWLFANCHFHRNPQFCWQPKERKLWKLYLHLTGLGRAWFWNKSQNHQGWKKPSSSSSPSAKQHHHGHPKPHHTSRPPEHLQRQRLHHPQCLSTLPGEYVFLTSSLNLHSAPKAVSSCAFTWDMMVMNKRVQWLLPGGSGESFSRLHPSVPGKRVWLVLAGWLHRYRRFQTWYFILDIYSLIYIQTIAATI